jgi:polysaccharide chain length determinant protein (PEP-CTERM system associated)
MDDSRTHPLDYVSVLRRRKRWLIWPVVAATVAGALLAVYLPREYLSRAVVGVAGPTVSPELAKAAPIGRDERIRAVSQQLLSRNVLERVVRDEGLAASEADLEEAIAGLRLRIRPVTVPESIAPSDSGARLDMFVVSYLDRTPHDAQRVANRLAEVFVEDTSRTRELRAEDTSEFLTSQLRAAEARLAELEDRLSGAKRANMGRLPEQTSANLQTLNGLRQQLAATDTALKSEQDRLSMIERQIDGMRQGLDGLPLVRGGEVPSTALGRVRLLERQLADARMVYTEKHPEIGRLDEELKQARAAADAERSRPAADRLAVLQNDPAYRQLLADQEMARLRVRDLQRAESQARRDIAAYQARVESAPLVEQQMASLQREYDLQKQQYTDLVGRRQAAGLAEDLERRRVGERFKVFTKASWPARPYRPNPWRVFAMSVMAGICLGGVAAMGREFMDRSVHDVRALQQAYDVPILGEVSRIRAA